MIPSWRRLTSSSRLENAGLRFDRYANYVPAQLGPQVIRNAQDAFVDGMQYALLGGAAALVVAAAAVAVLHRNSR